MQTCSRSYLHIHKAQKPDSGPDTPPGVSVLTPLPQKRKKKKKDCDCFCTFDEPPLQWRALPLIGDQISDQISGSNTRATCQVAPNLWRGSAQKQGSFSTSLPPVP